MRDTWGPHPLINTEIIYVPYESSLLVLSINLKILEPTHWEAKKARWQSCCHSFKKWACPSIFSAQLHHTVYS